MSNRRRANRFVVPHAGEATLRLMQDVFVERVEADGIELLIDTPMRAEETAILELPSGHGSRAAVWVTVQSSTPVALTDTQRHRHSLRMMSGPAPGQPFGTPGYRDVLAARRHLPAMGVVIRRVPVHMRDVSTSGCLIESPEVLVDGAVGLLEMAQDAGRHSEAIRICRVSRMPGAARPWRAGAHFLSLTAPSEASVRNIVARFEILDELSLYTPAR
jgi:hypothetical protein